MLMTIVIKAIKASQQLLNQLYQREEREALKQQGLLVALVSLEMGQKLLQKYKESLSV